jgi:hypothetical protein
MEGLGDLLGGIIFSEALDVSAHGKVVVGKGNSDIGTEAFIWSESNGMRNLSEVLTALGADLSGWTLVEAQGISDDELTIVGWGTNPLGYNEAFVAMVPEPATVLLLATGLAGLAASRRRSSLP